jgi:hypothetical protein
MWQYYSVHFQRWVVAVTFLTPPLKFEQSDHTQPSPRHIGSIYMSYFGYDAAISDEMIRRHHRHGKHFHRWVVAATLLTPPLDFYQIKHTGPSLRHHKSILAACFGQDAAIGGEMSRRRRQSSDTKFILIFLNSSSGGRAVCPAGE